MERNDPRLLSSLKDLRLIHQSSFYQNQENCKRKSKRLCPIKSIQDDKIYQNFITIDKRKNLLDISLLVKSLSNHFTFSSLISEKNLRNSLIEQFRLCKVQKGNYLIKQNDSASSFFVLHQGQLQIQINGIKEGYIKQGEGFGQLALLYSSPRSASIYALKSSFLWYIDRRTFRNIVLSMIEKTSIQNKKIILQNKLFTYLTETQRNKIVSIAINQRYQAGYKICKQGQMASAMYIVKSGKLKRVIKGTTVGFYIQGQYLQDYATLSKNCFRKETIIAQTECQVIAIGSQEIQKALGKSLPIILIQNKAKQALLNHQIFRILSYQSLQKIIDTFKIRKIRQNQYAFKKDELCRDKILFIIDGKHSLESKQDKIQLYGISSLTNKIDSRFQKDCIFETQGKVAEITTRKIQKALGCGFSEAIKKCISLRKVIECQKDKLNEKRQNSKKYNLKDFFVVKKLGEGQFGQVFLVTDAQRKQFYALKCISKLQTIKHKLQKHLVNQRTVLQSHQSPFIVDFLRSFKDKKYIYFLMQFINGILLFDVLRMIGLVSGQLSRFYSAIIFQSIQSLHKNGIIYRDLKPQNIIVCNDGYLKIIDMGTCKNLQQLPAKKTFTIIGTPNYMAPQILSGKGYSYSVDLWSLGIVLFQFLSGFLPFGQNCDDPYQIYQQILNYELRFPKYMKDQIANNFICQLLNRNPEARVGQSYSHIKNNLFFGNIQWEKLIQKQIQPSYKPAKKSIMKMENIPNDLKQVEHFLKNDSSYYTKRYDLNINWDNCF